VNIHSAESPTHSPRRRDAILQLVRDRAVRSQVELRQLLARRGVAVTQPTLSRDLRELGVAKTPRGYVVPDTAVARFAPAAARDATLARALRTFAVSVQAAASLVVVRTPPAGAHPLARALDEAAPAELVGTIAGDDTVFVATSSDGAARSLARRLTTALARRDQEVHR
jgi:transcriptional regulator of arginine metabolism